VSSVRTLLLVVDAVALIGVVAFSVLAALSHNATPYVIGQIACAALILASVVLLRRMGNHAAR
jgi:lipopolysaccharide export LptBFGC system permease protein LptF